ARADDEHVRARETLLRVGAPAVEDPLPRVPRGGGIDGHVTILPARATAGRGGTWTTASGAQFRRTGRSRRFTHAKLTLLLSCNRGASRGRSGVRRCG